MFITLLNTIFLSFFPISSFKELLDDPYADLKSFAESALSEQDSSNGGKVIDLLAIFDVYICIGCHYFFTIICYFFHVKDNKFLNYFFSLGKWNYLLSYSRCLSRSSFKTE